MIKNNIDEKAIKVGKPFIATKPVKPSNSVFVFDVIHVKGKLVDGQFEMDEQSLKVATLANRGLVEYVDDGLQLLLDFNPHLSLDRLVC